MPPNIERAVTSPRSSSCASTKDLKLSVTDSDRGVRGVGRLAAKAMAVYASDAGHRLVEADTDIRSRAGDFRFHPIAQLRKHPLEIDEVGGAERVRQMAERVERTVDRHQREFAAAARLFRFGAGGVRVARDQRAEYFHVNAQVIPQHGFHRSRSAP